MKKFDKKDVFSWANCEEAKQYIGQKGYMSNSSIGLQEAININRVYELKDIDEKLILCFYRPQCDYGRGLFLPADKVKEIEEKTWRPFNCIEEVFVTLNKDVGSFITYRTKDFPLRTITTTITGYAKEKNKEDQIQIGAGMIELYNCFEGIEIWNGKDWQPFGVYE